MKPIIAISISVILVSAIPIYWVFVERATRGIACNTNCILDSACRKCPNKQFVNLNCTNDSSFVLISTVPICSDCDTSWSIGTNKTVNWFARTCDLNQIVPEEVRWDSKRTVGYPAWFWGIGITYSVLAPCVSVILIAFSYGFYQKERKPKPTISNQI
jgi:hypothetical protein